MGKAGKLIVGAIITLIIVVGIVLAFVITNLDSIVERAIETVGSDVAGVPVDVGSVRISLQEGKGEINGLSLGNPAGFPRGKAFELGKIALQLDVQNLSAELVTIKSVLVDGARVNAIQGADGNNLKAILNNLESGAPAEESTADEGPGTKLIIDDFRFQNGEVNLTLPAVGERTAKIPNMQLTGIGRKTNGATAGEVAKQILDPIVRRSLTAMTGISAEDLKKMGREKMDDALKDGKETATRELGKFLNRGKD